MGMGPRTKRVLSALGGLLLACLVPARSFAQELASEPPPEDDPPKPVRFGTYTPGGGFKVAATEYGDLNIRVYSYVRYLNQKALDDTSTDSFGNTSTLDLRQDIQLNKVNVYFQGWLLNPKLRYVFYVWTANTSQGNGAQVVVGGNLNYRFNEHARLGFGIASLPGVRSTSGNFPFWLGVDNRLIADEFFRPSYTSGIWVDGTIVDGVNYSVMLGNNLSQLGVDAAQLDDGFDTWSAVVSWMPTTKEYGRASGFGDFDRHDKVATRFGFHYTRSTEDRQSQPGTDSPENSQIRISDGNVLFGLGLFGPGINIERVLYQMTSFDAGFKYKGFSVEGEYYFRQVDSFRGPGTDTLPFDKLSDNGFQLQTSAMVLPKTLQLYLSGSRIFGEYGDPWDARFGLNWFPWKNQVARCDTEVIYLSQSPVGALSLPYVVGGNGPVFHTNFEVNF